MNENRLFTLAETLEQVNPANFGMHRWLCTASNDDARTNSVDLLRQVFDLTLDGAAPTPAIIMRAAQDCGTIACLAGWTVMLFGSVAGLQALAGHLSIYAAHLLELSDQEEIRLFLPATGGVAWRDIAPADAADTVRRFATTGQVDWATALR